MDGRWYVLSDPVPRLQLPDSELDGVQCMCSGMREATAEEIQANNATKETKWNHISNES